MSDQLTLFAEGSLARTSRPQDAARELPAHVRDSGLSSPVSLARFDPDTSLWRTSQRCLVEGWTVFSETFPRSGLMRSGTAYRLPPLVRLTGGTGFGSSPTHSIPTPTASDHIQRKNTTGALNPDTNKAVSLDRFVQFWPTPTVNGNHNRAGLSAKSGDGLATAVRTWPTPTGNRRSGLQSHGVNAITGALNPTWVEWLMGFPCGWTDLEALETP